MEGILKNGRKVWIWYPDQCKLCGGFHFMSTNEPCDKEKTQRLIDDIRDLESRYHGVYGSIEFRCDYFNLDEEKWRQHQRYGQQDCTCKG